MVRMLDGVEAIVSCCAVDVVDTPLSRRGSASVGSAVVEWAAATTHCVLSAGNGMRACGGGPTAAVEAPMPSVRSAPRMSESSTHVARASTWSACGLRPVRRGKADALRTAAPCVPNVGATGVASAPARVALGEAIRGPELAQAPRRCIATATLASMRACSESAGASVPACAGCTVCGAAPSDDRLAAVDATCEPSFGAWHVGGSAMAALSPELPLPIVVRDAAGGTRIVGRPSRCGARGGFWPSACGGAGGAGPAGAAGVVVDRVAGAPPTCSEWTAARIPVFRAAWKRLNCSRAARRFRCSCSRLSRASASSSRRCRCFSRMNCTAAARCSTDSRRLAWSCLALEASSSRRDPPAAGACGGGRTAGGGGGRQGRSAPGLAELATAGTCGLLGRPTTDATALAPARVGPACAADGALSGSSAAGEAVVCAAGFAAAATEKPTNAPLSRAGSGSASCCDSGTDIGALALPPPARSPRRLRREAAVRGAFLPALRADEEEARVACTCHGAACVRSAARDRGALPTAERAGAAAGSGWLARRGTCAPGRTASPLERGKGLAGSLAADARWLAAVAASEMRAHACRAGALAEPAPLSRGAPPAAMPKLLCRADERRFATVRSRSAARSIARRVCESARAGAGGTAASGRRGSSETRCEPAAAESAQHAEPAHSGDVARPAAGCDGGASTPASAGRDDGVGTSDSMACEPVIVVQPLSSTAGADCARSATGPAVASSSPLCAAAGSSAARLDALLASSSSSGSAASSLASSESRVLAAELRCAASDVECRVDGACFESRPRAVLRLRAAWPRLGAGGTSTRVRRARSRARASRRRSIVSRARRALGPYGWLSGGTHSGAELRRSTRAPPRSSTSTAAPGVCCSGWR